MTSEEFKPLKARLTQGRVIIVTFTSSNLEKKLTWVARVVRVDKDKLLIKKDSEETIDIDIDVHRITRIVFPSNWIFVELLRVALGQKKAMDDILSGSSSVPEKKDHK
tara:strand:- start:1102 stop:1425 length:324 start_codon:yes stop_codon:yes gene_type:complete